MKKNLFPVLLLAVQTAFAQIISKDNSFASNGIYSMTSNYAWSKMIQASNGDIYYTFNKDNATPLTTFVSKLSANGNPDTAFGNNGELQLPYGAYESQLKLLPDGKLLLYSFDSSSNSAAIIRMLPNGQLDNAFGVNGVAKIANMNHDLSLKGYNLVLQGSKILVYGQETATPSEPTSNRICRLNENGTPDLSFGNNGSIHYAGAITLIKTDSQSNIICFGVSNLNNTYTRTITKYTSDGQYITETGNNGTNPINPASTQPAVMDSYNNIIYAELDASTTSRLYKMTPNGTLDTNFSNNFDSSYPSPFFMMIQNITEKNGYYYIGGTYYGPTYPSFFISRVKPNGQMDSTFHYFVETSQELESIGDMIVNDNNIIANGNNHIVKYLFNTSTMAVSSPFRSLPAITFENPVGPDLIYTSKDKVAKIEIFSPTGTFLKTINTSHTSVSDLPKGVYLAKVTFENGNSTTRKLIKN